MQLLSEKALFLSGERILVVADLHFGKINHFRQAGMPVPQAANLKNAETLIDLVNATSPRRVIFLGDLFHSHYNEEWEVLGQIVLNFPGCSFELVRGNHDILGNQQYERKGISVVDHLAVGDWILTHEPMQAEEIPIGKINMAGHLHPGARLEGRGRQGITLPCFWFSKNQIILPAFGSFTGLAIIRPGVSDQVYVIFENGVMEVPMAPSNKTSKQAR